MFKKVLILASILCLSLAAACTGQSTSAPVSTAGGTALTQITDSTQMTLKDKLGIGILSLDGTGLSVSAEQASLLLPLWQAVRSLGADSSAASQEIAAVYTQIQETLTADQLAQIEQLAWSQEELSSLVQQYQSQTSQASASSTAAASTNAQGQNMGGGPEGGLPPDGGIMMAGAGMGAGMELAGTQNITGETQQSLILSQASARRSVELNVRLADAVINLLQQQSAI